MHKIRRDIGKVLKDLATPTSNPRITKKHKSTNRTNKSLGHTTNSKMINRKALATSIRSRDVSQLKLQIQKDSIAKKKVQFVTIQEKPKLTKSSDNIQPELKIESVRDDFIEEISPNIVSEIKEDYDVESNVENNIESNVEKYVDSNVENNDNFEKQEIVLGWSNYCQEREKLSKWLVPWEDNPSIGRYTLIIQSLYTTTKIVRETMPARSDFQEDYYEKSLLSKEEYIEKLERLLMFMTSTDRQATIERYKAMLWATDNEFELMNELGTPQKLAVNLAKNYVPSTSTSEEQASTQETEQKDGDEELVKDKEISEDEKQKDIDSDSEANNKTNLTRFRSVAASNHAKDEERLPEGDLTEFVDMSQDDLLMQEDMAITKEELEEENQASVGDSVEKKPFPKSITMFLLLYIIWSMIALCFILITALIMTIAGSTIIYIPIETLMRLEHNTNMKDIVFMIGVILITLGIGGSLLLLVALFCKNTLRKLFKGIKNGVKKRRNWKLEAETYEEDK